MKYTREEAVKMVGEAAVNQVETINCEPTSRVIYPSIEPDHVGKAEFVASLQLEDGRTLTAFYYQEEAVLEDCEDLSMLDWTIEHYEVV